MIRKFAVEIYATLAVVLALASSLAVSVAPLEFGRAALFAIGFGGLAFLLGAATAQASNVRHAEASRK